LDLEISGLVPGEGETDSIEVTFNRVPVPE